MGAFYTEMIDIYDMPAVKDKKLVALLLEEALPAGCVVEGVDFNAPRRQTCGLAVALLLRPF